MAFSKRIYSCRTFWLDLCSLLLKLPLVGIVVAGRFVEHTLASKIMLVVSAVNECRYCVWFHSRMLVAGGTDRQEVGRLAALQPERERDPYEDAATAYAEQYARSGRNPGAAVTEELYRQYGWRKAKSILLFMEMVYFSNLAGNTFDAFFERLQGRRVDGSSLPCEIMIVCFSAPLLLPLKIMLDRGRQPGGIPDGR